jgi:FkbH-like protein
MKAKHYNSKSTEIETLSEMLGVINRTDTLDENSLTSVKIYVLRNFTIEGIDPYIKYKFLQSGLKADIIYGNYDSITQEIIDDSSLLYKNKTDLIVISLYLETYLSGTWRSNWDSIDVFDGLKTIYLELASKTTATILINTFISPFYSNYGVGGGAEFPSRFHETEKLNQMIRDFVRDTGQQFVLIDWARFIRLIGESDSLDYRFWYMSKSPFKKKFLEAYASEITTVTRALMGKSKKCLVLDCDNTLWGGVVGEDGLHGIALDPHSYPGNVFFEFQQSVIELYERGVILALCSKNNERDVWDVFENHQYCRLTRDHFSATRINWEDKASNIRAIAQELNIGLDSFVFVDDSSMECGLVGSMLPEVTVLQVPAKLYTYAQLLNRDGLFDSLASSKEDKSRSKMYRDESKRKTERYKFETIEQYLSSLSLSITVHQATLEEIPRISQLTQKTNQFNLTTRRYSEQQILSFINQPSWIVISLSVTDRFGAFGLTGVLIASISECTVYVNTYLLSCRVLGRNIEFAFFKSAAEIIHRRWNITNWRAEYIKTQKNKQVEVFLPALGFTITTRSDEAAAFELSDVNSIAKVPAYISVNWE